MKMTMLGAPSARRFGVVLHWCFESSSVLPAVLAEGGSGKGRDSCAADCTAAQINVTVNSGTHAFINASSVWGQAGLPPDNSPRFPRTHGSRLNQ